MPDHPPQVTPGLAEPAINHTVNKTVEAATGTEATDTEGEEQEEQGEEQEEQKEVQEEQDEEQEEQEEVTEEDDMDEVVARRRSKAATRTVDAADFSNLTIREEQETEEFGRSKQVKELSRSKTKDKSHEEEEKEDESSEDDVAPQIEVMQNDEEEEEAESGAENANTEEEEEEEQEEEQVQISDHDDQGEVKDHEEEEEEDEVVAAEEEEELEDVPAEEEEVEDEEVVAPARSRALPSNSERRAMRAANLDRYLGVRDRTVGKQGLSTLLTPDHAKTKAAAAKAKAKDAKTKPATKKEPMKTTYPLKKTLFTFSRFCRLKVKREAEELVGLASQDFTDRAGARLLQLATARGDHKVGNNFIFLF